MKILQINSVCGYGSTGRIAVDMYRDFEKQGHECLIAYGRGMDYQCAQQLVKLNLNI